MRKPVLDKAGVSDAGLRTKPAYAESVLSDAGFVLSRASAPENVKFQKNKFPRLRYAPKWCGNPAHIHKRTCKNPSFSIPHNTSFHAAKSGRKRASTDWCVCLSLRQTGMARHEKPLYLPAPAQRGQKRLLLFHAEHIRGATVRCLLGSSSRSNVFSLFSKSASMNSVHIGNANIYSSRS